MSVYVSFYVSPSIYLRAITKPSRIRSADLVSLIIELMIGYQKTCLVVIVAEVSIWHFKVLLYSSKQLNNNRLLAVPLKEISIVEKQPLDLEEWRLPVKSSCSRMNFRWRKISHYVWWKTMIELMFVNDWSNCRRFQYPLPHLQTS